MMTDLEIDYDADGVMQAYRAEPRSDAWGVPSLPDDIRAVVLRHGHWSGTRSFSMDGEDHPFRSRVVCDASGFREIALSTSGAGAARSAGMQDSRQLMALTGQMTLGILHKTGNMLTPVISYAALAESALEADDPMRRYMESILRNANACIGVSRRMIRFFFNANAGRDQCELDSFLPDMMLLASFGLGQNITLHIAAEPGIVLPFSPTEVFQVVGGLILATGGQLKMRAEITIGVFTAANNRAELTIDCPIEQERTGETRNLSLLRQALLHAVDLPAEAAYVRARVQREGGAFTWEQSPDGHHFRIELPALRAEGTEDIRVLVGSPNMEVHLAFAESGCAAAIHRVTDAGTLARVLAAAAPFPAVVLDSKLYEPTVMEAIMRHSPKARFVFLHEPDSIIVCPDNLPGPVVPHPVTAETVRFQIMPLMENGARHGGA